MKDLQVFMAKIGRSVHVRSFSQSCPVCQGGKTETFSEKGPHESRLRFAKKHLEDSNATWQKVLWSDDDLTFWAEF